MTDFGSSVRFRASRIRFALRHHLSTRHFEGSSRYWDERYRAGGDSGAGSYGRSAIFKADFLNRFVRKTGAQSVIEFGCGDGNQLSLADYPRYLGLDVSPRAIELCRLAFAADPTKEFRLADDYGGERADLALSLDVVFHLVEDGVYERYMRTLFSSAERFVIVYSTNSARRSWADRAHVRHRRFTDWVDRNAPGWVLREKLGSSSPAERSTSRRARFFVYTCGDEAAR